MSSNTNKSFAAVLPLQQQMQEVGGKRNGKKNVTMREKEIKRGMESCAVSPAAVKDLDRIQ